MKSAKASVIFFAVVALLQGCDHHDPAAPAADAAANSAKQALQKTGDALTDAAKAAQIEGKEMVDKANASGDVDRAKAALNKAGDEAKQALTVAGEKTKDLADKAKDTAQPSNDGSK
ncbi:MAG: hypothetical protein ABSF50_14705 [Burkholderiaceae bacterium]|jgi:hypothetical protein